MSNETEVGIKEGEDGIVLVDISKEDTSGDDVLELMENIADFLRKFSGQAKIIVNFTKPVTKIGNSQLRKKIVERVNKLYKDPGFSRLAICGINSLLRVAILFVVKATNISNIRVFESKDKAMKWLKES